MNIVEILLKNIVELYVEKYGFITLFYFQLFFSEIGDELF